MLRNLELTPHRFLGFLPYPNSLPSTSLLKGHYVEEKIPSSSTLVTCLVRLRWWRSVSKVVSTHPRGQPFSTGCFQKSFHSWVWGLHGVCDIGVCPLCWLMDASFIGRTNRFFNQGHDDILRLHTFPPKKCGLHKKKAWLSYIEGHRGTNYSKPSSLVGMNFTGGTSEMMSIQSLDNPPNCLMFFHPKWKLTKQRLTSTVLTDFNHKLGV